MSGPEIIKWALAKCQQNKLPPTDSAMIRMLREERGEIKMPPGQSMTGDAQ
jgi:hypothetical protein